jgi:hypothetical protein
MNPQLRELIDLIEIQSTNTIAEPFKLSELQKLKFTSGGGQIIENHQKCDSTGTGFYGCYFLIDNDFKDEIGRSVGGTITVHSKKEMSKWKSTDTDQTIWRIKLKSDVISVWDSIKIGLTRSEIEKFGIENNGFCIKKGDNFYSCDFSNFSVLYFFKNDILRELNITRKCEKKTKKLMPTKAIKHRASVG